MKLINNYDSTMFDDFRDIKQKKPHLNNLFFIESYKVYLKAVNSKINILKTITTKEVYESNPSKFNLGEVLITTPEILEKLVKFKSHTKIFSIAKIPNEKIDFNKDIIFFNNITSPENVGAIIRSALAFDFSQVAYDKKSLTPWNRRSVRVSTGNIFKFNSTRVFDSLNFLEICLKKDYEIIAMDNSPKAQNINTIKIAKKKLIILGSEGHGISDDILNFSTTILKIPVSEYVKHLNVGHAAAITFHELSK
jgi:tRNA G18 (ribose-2'-O)-methylase SpoU